MFSHRCIRRSGFNSVMLLLSHATHHATFIILLLLLLLLFIHHFPLRMMMMVTTTTTATMVMTGLLDRNGLIEGGLIINLSHHQRALGLMRPLDHKRNVCAWKSKTFRSQSRESLIKIHST